MNDDVEISRMLEQLKREVYFFLSFLYSELEGSLYAVGDFESLLIS